MATLLAALLTYTVSPVPPSCGFNSRIRTTSTLGADRVVSAHIGSEPPVVGKTASANERLIRFSGDSLN